MSSKKNSHIFLRPTLLALLVALTAVRAHAQTQDPTMTDETKAEMNAWMELAQPRERHQQLGAYVGRWHGEVRAWMAPGGEPMVEQTEAEARWIMGGRYLEWTHTGTFDGMAFEGRGIEGYNNGNQRYEAIWVDNFGTLILYYIGNGAEDGSTRVLTSQFTDPMTGGVITQRVVYTWVDDDHFTYESYMRRGELEFKNMEISYERAPLAESG